jgi:hypothetical protein
MTHPDDDLRGLVRQDNDGTDRLRHEGWRTRLPRRFDGDSPVCDQSTALAGNASQKKGLSS